MEDWSFPPKFNPDYLPDPASPYWFPKRETMDPGDREKAILERLKEITRYAYDKSPFYKRKWDDAGFHPDHLKSLEDFEDKVPMVTKQDLREAQTRAPKFGDYLCIPESEIHHIHGTSGTTGTPTVFAIGRGDWDSIANAHARIIYGMGLRPGDTIFIAAIFSLYLGSWGAMIGAERLHAKAFPFGAGAPGMSARAAQWLDQMKPMAFYGTPSYALHLGEVARKEGLDPKNFGLKCLFFSGEPGASIPGIRDKIKAIYGAQIYDSGSMAEMSPWMNCAGSEGTPEGMLMWQDIVYSEVCDPVNFRRVPYGQKGTPVYTHLERTSQPMIRLLSGDLTEWRYDGPAPCGRTYPHLPHGIFGRIDDQFTIRGENIYPSEIDAVLNKTDGYGGEHRIIVSREGTMDELLVRVEATSELHERGEEAITGFRITVADNLQRVLGVRTKVEIVPLNSIPRTDFKARRIIDDRDVFREMQGKMTGS